MCSAHEKIEIKVLTLNCWGVPFVSACRKERLFAISKEIASGNYEIVALQEIWAKADYEYLQQNTKLAMPYSYYFHSGVIGSGLCVFSKGIILDTLISRYSLNGHPHRLFHGDWFGGKAAALCKILYQGIKINLYITHTIARYDGLAGTVDTYYSHRLCQVLELAQFIRATQGWADWSGGAPCEVVILAGDLNLQPQELGLELLLGLAHLTDAWAVCNAEKLCETYPCGESDSSIDTFENGGSLPSKRSSTAVDSRNSFTYLNPDNTFCKRVHKQSGDPGQRIDYVMFKETDPDVAVTCSSCDVFCGKSRSPKNPDRTVSLSDHEAVLATFSFERKPSIDRSFVALNVKDDNGDVVHLLKRADAALQSAMTRSNTEARWYRYVALALTLLLLGMFWVDTPYGTVTLVSLCRTMVAMIISWCLWMGVVWHLTEINTVRGSVECVRLLLQRYKTLNGKDH